MPAAISVAPITLEGVAIRLEPLGHRHVDRLADAAAHADVSRYLVQPLRTREDVRAFVETALAAQAMGTALPFATVERATGVVIGSTRFANVEPAHRRAEIGWTWLGAPWQRTAANTEAKLLMLRHAFETWALNRVELKTDALNQRSQAAMLRIGATREGLFRNHMVMPDGRIRHTVWFSIVSEEWPAVKARLEGLMAARAATGQGMEERAR